MVKWTHHALSQLQNIYDYIKQNSPVYAKQVSDGLVQKADKLNDLPRMGRVVPELDETTVREISLYSYRILYEIKPTCIEILAIVHKRQNLQANDIPRK